jgi:hypothetical protein
MVPASFVEDAESSLSAAASRADPFAAIVELEQSTLANEHAAISVETTPTAPCTRPLVDNLIDDPPRAL